MVFKLKSKVFPIKKIFGIVYLIITQVNVMIFISYSVFNIKRDRQSCSAERSQQPSEERDTNIGMVFNFYNCLKKITLNHSGCWQILKARNFERTEVP